MTDNELSRTDLSRRSFLKRGAVLGGAVAWATPVIQVVGMTPALANHVSGCEFHFAIKIDRTDGAPTTPDFTDIAVEGQGAQDCLDLGPIGTLTVGSIAHIASVVIPEEGAADKCWTVTLDPGCQFLSGSCTAKVATTCPPSTCIIDPLDPSTIRICSTSTQDISHVELGFCCDHVD